MNLIGCKFAKASGDNSRARFFRGILHPFRYSPRDTLR
jgi:hypothetical protein